MYFQFSEEMEVTTVSRWIKFFLLYVGAVVVGLSQLKITPIIKPLSELLQVNITQMSLLTSVFTISGIFIAIPGGILVSKYGAKRLLLIVMSCLVFGNLLGILSNSFGLLLISRIIEGISFSTIVMIAVVLINDWFKKTDYSGTAIGIFTTFPATASLIGMNLFLPLSNKYGLFASSYLLGSIGLVLIILYYFLVDEPVKEEVTENVGLRFLKEAAENKMVWLLGVLQGVMAFVLYSYIALYPLFFTDYYNLSVSTANFYASLFGLFGIPFGVLAGVMIDRMENKGLIFISSYGMMFLACLVAPYLGSSKVAFITQIFFLSVSASLASSAVTIMVSKVVKVERLLGISLSIVNIFYYTCIVIGAPIVASVIEQISWPIGLLLLATVAFIGLLVSFVLSKLLKIKYTGGIENE